MNEISPDRLLAQIRTLNKTLQVPIQVDPAPNVNFGDMLKTTLDAVNGAQKHAGEMKVGFSSGSGDASLAQVMIATQKADLSFRAVTEVRNKLISAYQEIMNMPV